MVALVEGFLEDAAVTLLQCSRFYLDRPPLSIALTRIFVGKTL